MSFDENAFRMQQEQLMKENLLLKKEVEYLKHLISEKPDIKPPIPGAMIEKFQRIWEACLGLSEKADFKVLFKYAQELEEKLGNSIFWAFELVERNRHLAPAIFRCGGMMWLGESQRPVGGEWGCRFDFSADGKEDYVIGYGATPAEAIFEAVKSAKARKKPTL